VSSKTLRTFVHVDSRLQLCRIHIVSFCHLSSAIMSLICTTIRILQGELKVATRVKWALVLLIILHFFHGILIKNYNDVFKFVKVVSLFF